MNIQGLQKMTLLDWPGKVACTVFLGGCDFRCPYCHNSELVSGTLPPAMEEEALFAFLEKRRGILDGVCVTGGEPLLSPGLPEFLERIRALGYPVKLDTNGSSPDRLRRVWETGLVDYVAMDIKNCPEWYAQTAGVPRLDPAPVMESAAWLLAGRADYEFRTTVVRQFHDEEAMEKIGRWIRGAKRYYLQAFADRDTVPVSGLAACSGEEMERFADVVRPFVPSVQLRGL